MNDESRPEAAHETTTKKSTSSIPPTSDSTVLDALSGNFMRGYLSGFTAGIDHGRQQLDDELAALQRRAHQIVKGMSKFDTWEQAEEKRQQRQMTAAETARREARPWPDEAVAR